MQGCMVIKEKNPLEIIKIEELGISTRVINRLRRAGIDTVLDLINKSEHDLLKIRKLGPKGIEEIIKKLAEKGLRLFEEVDNEPCMIWRKRGSSKRKSLAATKKLLKCKEISYVSEGYYHAHHRRAMYFDFVKHKWAVNESEESPVERDKKTSSASKGIIPRAAEEEFAARLYFIQNLRKDEYFYDGIACDSPTVRAYVFGKTFSWKPVTTFGMAFFGNLGDYGVGYRNGGAERCRQVLDNTLYSELFDQISYAFNRLKHVCENPEEEPPEDAFIPVEDYREKAVEQYKKKAAQGNADAICHLGDLYFYGVYVEQNQKYALELYKKAAEKGDLPAMNMLADLYYYGGGGLDQNYQQAILLYRTLSRKKVNLYVQYQLGKMYLTGQGVKKNEKRAVKYFWLTGYYDYEPGTWEYIKCLYYGIGVKQDRKKAMTRKYRISGQHQQELVRMLENDFDTLDWDVKYELAMLYQNLIHHKSWEREKYTEEEKRLDNAANKIIYEAADNGCAAAEHEMGFFCHIGPDYGSPDIPKNEEKALEWYTKSAEHGYFDSQWELVLYYMNGTFDVCETIEDKINLDKARYWFKRISPEEQKRRFHVTRIGRELGICTDEQIEE